MPSLSKLSAVALLLVAPLAVSSLAAAQNVVPATSSPTLSVPPETLSSGRVVLVLPFDNRTGDASLAWVGDSFPDTLNKRLSSAGFLTISHDDRTFAFDHLGLPTEFKPSRATTIRIAQQLDANYVVIGSYTLQPAAAASAAAPAGTAPDRRIAVEARVMSIDALQLSATVTDSGEFARLFDVQNAIAWKVARMLDPHFSVAEGTFLAAPGTVPLPAFESYIRGTNAPASVPPAERIKRLQSAVSLAPGYAAALLALGKEQYAARDFEGAAATLARVPANDRLALEADFYLGLARFNSANYIGAQQAFDLVAARLPLPEVINDQGVALARQGRSADRIFQHASAADPSDEDYHYNLALSLFRSGDTAGALRETELALQLKPADNEAVELRRQLKLVAPGTKLVPSATSTFNPLERIRRSYSETGFRQAEFQLDQLRAARLAALPAADRAAEYLQVGQQYLQQGLLPEAETQFQAALTAAPNSAAAHAGLARIRESSGDAAQAREQAALSVKLQSNVSGWLTLAQLDLSASHLPECATDVTNALHLEPANPEALTLRAALQQRGVTVP